MSVCKLILKNVRRNLSDYLIYFLTLMLSVSLFYAFNSIPGQPAFQEMSVTKALLYQQLDDLLAFLSAAIAVVLAFLVIYANGFLLRRRKKELGLYLLLGMKKSRISRIFVGETFCVGLLSLAGGILLGLFLSQGLSLVSLRLFAVELESFRFVFSLDALRITLLCFACIFVIVMLFNICSVVNVRLIDLITANRKNQVLKSQSPILHLLCFAASLILLAYACILLFQNGILPSRENNRFQLAGTCLILGILLFYRSASIVLVTFLKAWRNFYFTGLNTFLLRQVSSHIHTNYLVMAVVCGLLTVSILTVSTGVSTELAMNELSQASSPYDLNVLSDVDKDGDGSIEAYLKSQNVDLSSYARSMEQISIYEADLTYGELFEGQKLHLWSIDEALPSIYVNVISISDFNRALSMQEKESISLQEDEFLINCNYEGTMDYARQALIDHPTLTIAGNRLTRRQDTLLTETYYMTSIGNNDRATIIVPDRVASLLNKDVNVLLVQYKAGTDSDEIVRKMVPIGLDESHGYRYAEKTMMYDMYFGSNALLVLLCCYLGLVFLTICAAILALKQLTETADSLSRYGLLKKLGADESSINQTVLAQTFLFFAAPLALAAILSGVLLTKAVELVEGFLNIHISGNVWLTIAVFLLIYGGYFLASYLTCRKIIRDMGVSRSSD